MVSYFETSSRTGSPASGRVRHQFEGIERVVQVETAVTSRERPSEAINHSSKKPPSLSSFSSFGEISVSELAFSFRSAPLPVAETC